MEGGECLHALFAGGRQVPWYTCACSPNAGIGSDFLHQPCQLTQTGIRPGVHGNFAAGLTPARCILLKPVGTPAGGQWG